MPIYTSFIYNMINGFDSATASLPVLLLLTKTKNIYLSILPISVCFQLQERIQDLEKERDLLKENCDKLVKRWEDKSLNGVH